MSNDFIPGLCIFCFVIFALWALLVHPQEAKKEIALKALETYQLELKAGISEKNSKAAPLLREFGRNHE